MNTIKTLIDSGLSVSEAKVYLAALEMGPALFANVAQKAQIKRPSLYYDILPGLLAKGLVTETVKGKRKYLVAQDFQAYLDNKKAELERAEQLVPGLRVLLASAAVKPKILVYEGMEGVKKVWFDHLVQRQPILELVGIDNIYPDLQKYIKNYYVIERTKRRIPLKMLISGPAQVDVFNMKTDPYELREVKTMDGKLFPIPGGINIYGDNISLNLYRKGTEPIGMIIRSREVATMMRSIFIFLWDQL